MRLRGLPKDVQAQVDAMHENFAGRPDFEGNLNLRLSYTRGRGGVAAWTVQITEHGLLDSGGEGRVIST